MSDTRRWFHAIVTVYGAWLPGDPRGFRTRHHRDDVAGDYRNPPPSAMYEDLHDACRQSMAHTSVKLSPPQREVVGKSLLAQLQQDGEMVAALAMSALHGHCVTSLPPQTAKLVVGDAKKNAWFRLRDQGTWKRKLWAKGCKCEPVRDDAHFRNATRYVLDHRDVGAWVWEADPMPSFGDVDRLV